MREGNNEECGVPGQVRTANLPLRRGMLYPIELLRPRLPARMREAIDGVHVNGRATLCHVVLGRFKCRQTPPESLRSTVKTQKLTKICAPPDPLITEIAAFNPK